MTRKLEKLICDALDSLTRIVQYNNELRFLRAYADELRKIEKGV